MFPGGRCRVKPRRCLTSVPRGTFPGRSPGTRYTDGCRPPPKPRTARPGLRRVDAERNCGPSEGSSVTGGATGGRVVRRAAIAGGRGPRVGGHDGRTDEPSDIPGRDRAGDTATIMSSLRRWSGSGGDTSSARSNAKQRACPVQAQRHEARGLDRGHEGRVIAGASSERPSRPADGRSVPAVPWNRAGARRRLVPSPWWADRSVDVHSSPLRRVERELSPHPTVPVVPPPRTIAATSAWTLGNDGALDPSSEAA